MTVTRREFAALTLGLPLAWSAPARASGRPPLVIAGGGAAGDSPAGSQGAYELAIRDGADFIAANLAVSKDGTLLALRDNELSAAGADVASRPEFAERRQSRFVGGAERSGWFAEDFNLAELKTLVLGPSGQRRGGRTGDGGGHAILTLEDLIAVARAGSVRTARVIGVHASMVHPAYFAGLDLAVEPRLASVIRSAGYNAPAAAMFVASPEINALKTIGELTRARRVLRIAADTPAPTALTAILAHAEAMAVGADLLLDLSSARTLPATPLVADAHATGLAVQAWTNDADTPFPPPPLRSGDARRLLAALFAAGVDAVAGDLAGPIVRARDDAAPRDRG